MFFILVFLPFEQQFLSIKHLRASSYAIAIKSETPFFRQNDIFYSIKTKNMNHIAVDREKNPMPAALHQLKSDRFSCSSSLRRPASRRVVLRYHETEYTRQSRAVPEMIISTICKFGSAASLFRTEECVGKKDACHLRPLHGHKTRFFLLFRTKILAKRQILRIYRYNTRFASFFSYI